MSTISRSRTPAGIFTVAMILMAVAAIVAFAMGFQGLTKSDGFRVGMLQKLSRKGIIWRTWEGELALEGQKFSGSQETGIKGGSTFEFSVWELAVAHNLSNAASYGGAVKLHYRQHRWVFPWQGDTAYEIFYIEALDK